MVFTYYMHTKELHAVYQNHASYQASWVSTSTTSNSYPHIIHVNIFSIHIPTSFSQKKKTKNKKLLVIQTKKSTCKLDFFFQFSQLKKKQHAYTNIILTKKLHVIQTKKLTCKVEFFPVFQLRKTACIYQHHSHKKKKVACYSNQ